MCMTRQDLEAAVKTGLLREEQAQRLWDFLAARSPLAWRMAAYYAGALLITAALSVFSVTGWAVWGGAGVLVLSLLYIGGLVYLSETMARAECISARAIKHRTGPLKLDHAAASAGRMMTRATSLPRSTVSSTGWPMGHSERNRCKSSTVRTVWL
jgi:hypothetical protein